VIAADAVFAAAAAAAQSEYHRDLFDVVFLSIQIADTLLMASLQ